MSRYREFTRRRQYPDPEPKLASTASGQPDLRLQLITCSRCGIEKRPNAFAGGALEPVCRGCRNRA